MFRKFAFFVSLFFCVAVSAGPREQIRDFLRKKYFKDRKASLILEEDSGVPFARAKIYRVRDFTGQRGWIILETDTGNISEADRTSVEKFLRSLERGLVKMSFEKKDQEEAARISNLLLNFLGPWSRNVVCTSGKERAFCELSFSEGPLAAEKANLLYDFKEGFILVRKKAGAF